MAVEYMDSFDTFNTAQVLRYYPSSSACTIAAGLGGSTGALQITNGATCPIALTARATYIFGFDLKNGLSGANVFRIMGSGGTAILCNFQITTSGVLSTSRGDSAAGAMLSGTAQAIQIKYVISATVGMLIVKVDGVTIINLTGINTGTSNIDGFLFLNTLGAAGSFQVDNFWVMNTLGSHSNDFPVGRMSMQVKYPTGDGTYATLTPNSGSTHYDQIAETPPDDDTTYNKSLTAGAKDTYTIPALTGSILNVHAVKVTAVVRKIDVDTKTARVLVKSGATLNEGADIDVPLTYKPFSSLLTDDPNTATQWAEANVNAMEPGAKVMA